MSLTEQPVELITLLATLSLLPLLVAAVAFVALREHAGLALQGA